MFPDSTKGLKTEGDYSSSPKIWEDKAGFAAKIAELRQGRDRGSKAKIKDLDSLKATVPAIGKACGGCHETLPRQEQLVRTSSLKRLQVRSLA